MRGLFVPTANGKADGYGRVDGVQPIGLFEGLLPNKVTQSACCAFGILQGNAGHNDQEFLSTDTGK